MEGRCPNPPSTFDYVIVGGGSAGCALAHRLSEDPAASVLLLESGPEGTLRQMHEPLTWGLLLGSEVDWAYQTIPQLHAALRRIDWPRAHVLGVSGSLNAMIHMRGTPMDYDMWALLGNIGWDWQSVLPAFKDIEDYSGGKPEYHGTGGGLRLSLPTPSNPVSEAAIQAAVELGYPLNDEFNGGAIEGVGWNQLAVADGRRQSAAQAFLAPVLDRANLTVITGAHPTRIVLDAAKRVSAVEYILDGSTQRVGVDAEAILSSGAIESPKLLLLSGIGPAEDLRRLGIRIEIDLPGVGTNLHDHLGAPLTFEASSPIPAGHHQQAEVGLFCKSDPSLIYPDLQIAVPHVQAAPEGLSAPANSFAVFPSLLKPRSRGWVKLAGTDPSQHPLINPNYLAQDADVTVLVQSVHMSRELANTSPLREWNAGEAAPGPGVRSDSALRDYIRKAVGTWFHPVGTCKMGVDAAAVVDPRLRLYGVDNLRVADASIMPEVTSANSDAPTLMIGWRVADFIRDAVPTTRSYTAA